MEITKWLKKIGFEIHSEAFLENGITIDDLKTLTSEDLKNELGISRLADRKKILNEIESLFGGLNEEDVQLIASLPYVIAYPLKRTLLEKHSWTRINLFKDTFQNYLKYLALFAATEFFNSPFKDKKIVALFQQTLAEPSFGTWNHYIREVLQFLKEKKHFFFCQHLPEYYELIETGSKSKKYKGEIQYIDGNGDAQLIKQEASAIGILINFRNRYLGHGLTLDVDSSEKLWKEYFPIFRQLLAQMTFANNYPMFKYEHGETYNLQSAEIGTVEKKPRSATNVWIENPLGDFIDVLPFYIVPGEVSISKEDIEQIMVYESFRGNTITFFSPEGTEKRTSGRILERLNLLLREKQKEEAYTPDTFTTEVFLSRIADENRFILETLGAEKKIIPGVYVHRGEMEMHLRSWIGARTSIFFIAAEAGSGKTNLLAEIQRQYTARGLSSLMIRAGRMQKKHIREELTYLLNIDPQYALEKYQAISGTQSDPVFVLIDGLNEAQNADELWLEILSISKLFDPGSIKFVVTARANTPADIDTYSLSSEEEKVMYGENKENSGGLRSFAFWLTALNMVEMKMAWEDYAKKEKGLYKPLFSFDDLATFDRALYDQINNPLVLRIFLQLYHGKSLSKKGSKRLHLWHDWLLTFTMEEQRFLALLADEIWDKGVNELLLDDLLNNEKLRPYFVYDNIDSPYQRLKNLGWISRYSKDLISCIGFTVEGALLYLVGKQLQDGHTTIDVPYMQSVLENGSRLQISCIESFLCEEAWKGELSLVTELIDTGDQFHDHCTRPLLHHMKTAGVESTLAKVLVNTTENDWQALLKLDRLICDLEYIEIREKLLINIINKASLKNSKETCLVLRGIRILESTLAKNHYQKIEKEITERIVDLDLLEELGFCEKHFGNYNKSLNYFQKLLTLEIEIYGKNHRDVCASYDVIGGIHEILGEYKKSIDFYEKSLIIKKNILGIDHPDIAESYHNLGNAWRELGDYSKSLENLEQCISIILLKYGNMHHNVGSVFNSIALVWYKLEDFDKALDFFLKSLNITIEIWGPNHHEVGSVTNNVGLAYHGLKQYSKALDYYSKSVDIRVKTLGEEHHIMATTYNNIGLIWSEIGENERAFENYDKCLKIRIKTFGKIHPQIANSYDCLGGIYESLGNSNKALNYFHKALEIRLKFFDKLHPYVGLSYSLIGDALDKSAEHLNAISYKEKALEIAKITFDENHFTVAKIYNSLGASFASLGKHADAISFYLKCLDILTFKHGEELAVTYHNIGDSYFSMEDFLSALNYFKESLSINKNREGVSNDDLGESYFNVGICYKKLKNYNQAITELKEGFSIHPKGGFVFQIAQCFELLGDKENALIHFIQCAEIRRDDPEVGLEAESTIESISTAKRLAAELKKTGELPAWILSYKT